MALVKTHEKTKKRMDRVKRDMSKALKMPVKAVTYDMVVNLLLDTFERDVRESIAASVVDEAAA